MTAAGGIEDAFAALRRAMVEQIERHAERVADRTGRAAISAPVLEAVGRIPRHAFVPVEMAARRVSGPAVRQGTRERKKPAE
ncbi:MAG: hypothetical protein F4X35_07100, partial [Alphaproteobacteria bacterium]|nr:hypothetical protein [Alphaproteobacteria bacterium]